MVSRNLECPPRGTESAGPGELVAGAGGALLLLATFLPWFGVDSAVQLPGRDEATTVRGVGVSAWHAFAAIDVVLLAVAIVAICLLALPFLGLRVALLRWPSRSSRRDWSARSSWSTG